MDAIGCYVSYHGPAWLELYFLIIIVCRQSWSKSESHHTYLDQQSDGSGGLVGNKVPEGQLADGAWLFQRGAPNMGFIPFQSHWCSFQIGKVTYRGSGAVMEEMDTNKGERNWSVSPAAPRQNTAKSWKVRSGCEGYRSHSNLHSHISK